MARPMSVLVPIMLKSKPSDSLWLDRPSLSMARRWIRCHQGERLVMAGYERLSVGYGGPAQDPLPSLRHLIQSVWGRGRQASWPRPPPRVTLSASTSTAAATSTAESISVSISSMPVASDSSVYVFTVLTTLVSHSSVSDVSSTVVSRSADRRAPGPQIGRRFGFCGGNQTRMEGSRKHGGKTMLIRP